METVNKLTYFKTNYYTEDGEQYRIITKVSLDDDCHNNMCDWSITADIDCKNKYDRYIDYMGGCCHKEIIKHCPELAKFIPLHLSNHYGAPMYPEANGTYHAKKSGMKVTMEYLRISEEEYVELSSASDDKLYFKYQLFNLGIVYRWKRESDVLIEELEKLSGKKWVNPYKPEEERFTLKLTEEEKLLIEDRIRNDYYSVSNIEKRKEEAHQAAIAKERANICKRFDEKILEAETEKKIYLYVLDHGLPIDNMIFYSHKNTVVFNWRDYGDKITQGEFVNFVTNIDYSQLPEGIKFEIK
ncbi:hypothetical protein DWW91_11380 [Parabacteroides sp. AF17-3]|uniref:hypothetical protein n=1 Tax=Parabacteroides sp. AF17-3 TaxID=2293113 RepID=UPI000F00F99E|nr:hypothetical protein [Parabacteroides sp. AF17-3]RKU69588.1 hypothetical protein DWW91_11380 [Parabacteroides sp. AF17-3]